MKNIIEIIKRKWAEYLLEMLVITISILGAFFLEEWDEDKLLEERQNAALNQLIVDLNNSIADLDDMRYIYDYMYLACHKMRQTFWVPDRQHFDSISQFILTPMRTHPYNPIMGTARSLINSGNIDLIGSDELKGAIISYVELVDAKLHDIDRFKRSYYESGITTLRKYIDYNILEANHSRSRISNRLQNYTDEQLVRSEVPKDFKKIPFDMTVNDIFDSKDVYIAYSKLITAHRNMSENYGDILELNKSLINTLEEHGYGANFQLMTTDTLVSDTLYQKILGKYDWPNSSVDIEIVTSENRLFLIPTNSQRLRITYLGDYNFSINRIRNKFVLNEKNEIIGFIAYFASGEVMFKKVSNHKIELDDAIIDKYLGKYEFAPGFILSIFKEGTKIYGQATGQEKFEIIPFEENKFSLVDVDARLTFNSDESAKVNSLTLHEGGDTEYKKIE